MNREAQKNIGLTIQDLISQNRIDLVALEGAFAPIDLTPLRTFPHQDTVRKVADYLLRENQISGPIHAALASSKRIPAIIGVDDPRHHRANVNAYKESALKVKELKDKWTEFSAELVNKKKIVFNPNLLAFDQKVQAYQEGKIELGLMVRFLSKTANKIPMTMQLFLEALILEDSLNFPKVEAERSRLLSNLFKQIDQTQTNEFINAGIAYRSGKISHTDFYRSLLELCEKNGIALNQYPTMKDYLQYVLLTDRIDAEKLFNEMRQLEEEIYNSLAMTPSEKNLIKESRSIYLMGKLLDFSLTPEEWGEYKKLSVVSRQFSVKSFEDFYEEAENRDKAMAANLLAQLLTTDNYKLKTTILVTGGFHSRGIDEKLVQAGCTVINFVPKISKVDTENGAAYLSVFTQEKSPLEKLFEGDMLFLAKNPISKSAMNLAKTLRDVETFRRGFPSKSARVNAAFKRVRDDAIQVIGRRHTIEVQYDKKMDFERVVLVTGMNPNNNRWGGGLVDLLLTLGTAAFGVGLYFLHDRWFSRYVSAFNYLGIVAGTIISVWAFVVISKKAWRAFDAQRSLAQLRRIGGQISGSVSTDSRGSKEAEAAAAPILNFESRVVHSYVEAAKQNPARSIAYNPSRPEFAVTRGNSIIILDVHSGELVRSLDGHANDVTALFYSPDGRTLLSGGRDGTALLWELESAQPKMEWKAEDISKRANAVTAVAFSPDESTIAIGFVNGTLEVWDIGRNEKVWDYKSEGGITSVAFNSTGECLAFGTNRGTVAIHHARSGKFKNQLTIRSGVNAVAFSPKTNEDGATLAVAGRDNHVYLWDITTNGRERQILSGHKGGVTSVVFHSNGKHIFSGSQDKTVRVWDVETGSSRAVLTGHNELVISLALGPDGHTLLSGDWNGEVRKWWQEGRPGADYTDTERAGKKGIWPMILPMLFLARVLGAGLFHSKHQASVVDGRAKVLNSAQTDEPGNPDLVRHIVAKHGNVLNDDVVNENFPKDNHRHVDSSTGRDKRDEGTVSLTGKTQGLNRVPGENAISRAGIQNHVNAINYAVAGQFDLRDNDRTGVPKEPGVHQSASVKPLGTTGPLNVRYATDWTSRAITFLWNSWRFLWWTSTSPAVFVWSLYLKAIHWPLYFLRAADNFMAVSFLLSVFGGELTRKRSIGVSVGQETPAQVHISPGARRELPPLNPAAIGYLLVTLFFSGTWAKIIGAVIRLAGVNFLESHWIRMAIASTSGWNLIGLAVLFIGAHLLLIAGRGWAMRANANRGSPNIQSSPARLVSVLFSAFLLYSFILASYYFLPDSGKYIHLALDSAVILLDIVSQPTLKVSPSEPVPHPPVTEGITSTEEMNPLLRTTLDGILQNPGPGGHGENKSLGSHIKSKIPAVPLALHTAPREPQSKRVMILRNASFENAAALAEELFVSGITRHVILPGNDSPTAVNFRDPSLDGPSARQKFLADLFNCSGGDETFSLIIDLQLFGTPRVVGHQLTILSGPVENLPPDVEVMDSTEFLRRMTTRHFEEEVSYSSLVPAQKTLVDQFVDGLQESHHVKNPLRRLFAILAQGGISIDDMFGYLRYFRFIDHEIRRLITEFFMTGKKEEVRDSRRPASVSERLAAFAAHKKFLTQEGQKALRQSQEHLEKGDEASVLKILPSVAAPHLEYFVPISVNEKKIEPLLRNLGNLRITQGCSRGCLHCYFSPSRVVSALPFQRILQVLELIQRLGIRTVGPEGFLTLYYDTEMFDYYDPLFDADVGDVVQAILRNLPQQRIHITTRGWYLGDRIGPRAAAKIKEISKRDRKRLDVRVSVDLYDTLKDGLRYVARILNVIETFANGKIRIVAVGDEKNYEQISFIVRLIRRLTPDLNIRADNAVISFFRRREPDQWFSIISALGRAEGLPSSYQYDVGRCMFGINILADGRVLQKSEKTPKRERFGTKAEVAEHDFVDTQIRLWSPEEMIPVHLPQFNRDPVTGFVLDLLESDHLRDDLGAGTGSHSDIEEGAGSSGSTLNPLLPTRRTRIIAKRFYRSLSPNNPLRWFYYLTPNLAIGWFAAFYEPPRTFNPWKFVRAHKNKTFLDWLVRIGGTGVIWFGMLWVPLEFAQLLAINTSLPIPLILAIAIPSFLVGNVLVHGLINTIVALLSNLTSRLYRLAEYFDWDYAAGFFQRLHPAIQNAMLVMEDLSPYLTFSKGRDVTDEMIRRNNPTLVGVRERWLQIKNPKIRQLLDDLGERAMFVNEDTPRAWERGTKISKTPVWWRGYWFAGGRNGPARNVALRTEPGLLSVRGTGEVSNEFPIHLQECGDMSHWFQYGQLEGPAIREMIRTLRLQEFAMEVLGAPLEIAMPLRIIELDQIPYQGKLYGVEEYFLRYAEENGREKTKALLQSIFHKSNPGLTPEIMRDWTLERTIQELVRDRWLAQLQTWVPSDIRANVKWQWVAKETDQDFEEFQAYYRDLFAAYGETYEPIPPREGLIDAQDVQEIYKKNNAQVARILKKAAVHLGQLVGIAVGVGAQVEDALHSRNLVGFSWANDFDDTIVPDPNQTDFGVQRGRQEAMTLSAKEMIDHSVRALKALSQFLAPDLNLPETHVAMSTFSQELENTYRLVQIRVIDNQRDTLLDHRYKLRYQRWRDSDGESSVLNYLNRVCRPLLEDLKNPDPFVRLKALSDVSDLSDNKIEDAVLDIALGEKKNIGVHAIDVLARHLPEDRKKIIVLELLEKLSREEKDPEAHDRLTAVVPVIQRLVLSLEGGHGPIWRSLARIDDDFLLVIIQTLMVQARNKVLKKEFYHEFHREFLEILGALRDRDRKLKQRFLEILMHPMIEGRPHPSNKIEFLRYMEDTGPIRDTLSELIQVNTITVQEVYEFTAALPQELRPQVIYCLGEVFRTLSVLELDPVPAESEFEGYIRRREAENKFLSLIEAWDSDDLPSVYFVPNESRWEFSESASIQLFEGRVRSIPYVATRLMPGVSPDARVLAFFLDNTDGFITGIPRAGHVFDCAMYARFYFRTVNGKKSLVVAEYQNDSYRESSNRKNFFRTLFQDWPSVMRLVVEHHARRNGAEQIISPIAETIQERWRREEGGKGINGALPFVIYDNRMTEAGYRKKRLAVDWERGIKTQRKWWVKDLNPSDPIATRLQTCFHEERPKTMGQITREGHDRFLKERSETQKADKEKEEKPALSKRLSFKCLPQTDPKEDALLLFLDGKPRGVYSFGMDPAKKEAITSGFQIYNSGALLSDTEKEIQSAFNWQLIQELHARGYRSLRVVVSSDWREQTKYKKLAEEPFAKAYPDSKDIRFIDVDLNQAAQVLVDKKKLEFLEEKDPDKLLVDLAMLLIDTPWIFLALLRDPDFAKRKWKDLFGAYFAAQESKGFPGLKFAHEMDEVLRGYRWHVIPSEVQSHREDPINQALVGQIRDGYQYFLTGFLPADSELRPYLSTDPDRILRAFQKNPRFLHMPTVLKEASLEQSGIPVSRFTNISQPFLVSLQLSALDVRPGQNIGEVGFGSGWVTNILADLVGESGRVDSVDIINSTLLENALSLSRVLGHSNVGLRAADAREEAIQNAPFDRLLVSAGAQSQKEVDHFLDQVKEGGRLIIPYKNATWLYVKETGGVTRKIKIIDSSFQPLQDMPFVGGLFYPLHGIVLFILQGGLWAKWVVALYLIVGGAILENYLLGTAFKAAYHTSKFTSEMLLPAWTIFAGLHLVNMAWVYARPGIKNYSSVKNRIHGDRDPPTKWDAFASLLAAGLISSVSLWAGWSPLDYQSMMLHSSITTLFIAVTYTLKYRTSRLAPDSVPQRIAKLAVSKNTYKNSDNRELYRYTASVLGTRGGRALDVGAGGNDLPTLGLLEAGVSSVIKLDETPDPLGLTNGHSLRHEQGDATNLPFPDNHFRFVVFNQSLHFIRDYSALAVGGPEHHGPFTTDETYIDPMALLKMQQEQQNNALVASLSESFRVLEPGGWVLIKPGNHHTLDLRLTEGPLVAETLKEIGFENIQVVTKTGNQFGVDLSKEEIVDVPVFIYAQKPDHKMDHQSNGFGIHDVLNHYSEHDSKSSAMESSAYRSWVIQQIEELLPKGADILSLGAGEGTLELLLQQLGFNVTAVDIVPKFYERMKQRGIENAVLADARTLDSTPSLSEKKFDLIIFSDSLGHMGLKTLKTMTKYLKPNGVVLIADHSYDAGEVLILDVLEYPVHRNSQEVLENQMAAHGFTLLPTLHGEFGDGNSDFRKKMMMIRGRLPSTHVGATITGDSSRWMILAETGLFFPLSFIALCVSWTLFARGNPEWGAWILLAAFVLDLFLGPWINWLFPKIHPDASYQASLEKYRQKNLPLSREEFDGNLWNFYGHTWIHMFQIIVVTFGGVGMLFFAAIQNPSTAFLVVGTLALVAGWVENFFRHVRNNDNFFAFGPSDLVTVGAMASAKKNDQPSPVELKDFIVQYARTHQLLSKSSDKESRHYSYKRLTEFYRGRQQLEEAEIAENLLEKTDWEPEENYVFPKTFKENRWLYRYALHFQEQIVGAGRRPDDISTLDEYEYLDKLNSVLHGNGTGNLQAMEEEWDQEYRKLRPNYDDHDAMLFQYWCRYYLNKAKHLRSQGDTNSAIRIEEGLDEKFSRMVEESTTPAPNDEHRESIVESQKILRPKMKALAAIEQARYYDSLNLPRKAAKFISKVENELLPLLGGLDISEDVLFPLARYYRENGNKKSTIRAKKIEESLEDKIYTAAVQEGGNMDADEGLSMALLKLIDHYLYTVQLLREKNLDAEAHLIEEKIEQTLLLAIPDGYWQDTIYEEVADVYLALAQQYRDRGQTDKAHAFENRVIEVIGPHVQVNRKLIDYHIKNLTKNPLALNSSSTNKKDSSILQGFNRAVINPNPEEKDFQEFDQFKSRLLRRRLIPMSERYEFLFHHEFPLWMLHHFEQKRRSLFKENLIFKDRKRLVLILDWITDCFVGNPSALQQTAMAILYDHGEGVRLLRLLLDIYEYINPDQREGVRIYRDLFDTPYIQNSFDRKKDLVVFFFRTQSEQMNPQLQEKIMAHLQIDVKKNVGHFHRYLELLNSLPVEWLNRYQNGLAEREFGGFSEERNSILSELVVDVKENLRLDQEEEQKFARSLKSNEQYWLKNNFLNYIAIQAAFFTPDARYQLKEFVTSLETTADGKSLQVHDGSHFRRIAPSDRKEEGEKRFPQPFIQKWKQEKIILEDGSTIQDSRAQINYDSIYQNLKRHLRDSRGLVLKESPSGYLFIEVSDANPPDGFESIKEHMGQLLDRLRENVRPSLDAIQLALRALETPFGKSFVHKEVGENIKALIPKASTVELNGQSFVRFTFDPSLFMRAGIEPQKTCQRCTDRSGSNQDGQLITRIQHGQFKLAQYGRGNTILLRAFLEVTIENDKPVLLVETFYPSLNIPVDQTILEQEIYKYAQELGISHIYWADPPKSDSLKKKTKNRPIPKTLKTWYGNATAYRDHFYEAGTEYPSTQVTIETPARVGASIWGDSSRWMILAETVLFFPLSFIALWVSWILFAQGNPGWGAWILLAAFVLDLFFGPWISWLFPKIHPDASYQASLEKYRQKNLPLSREEFDGNLWNFYGHTWIRMFQVIVVTFGGVGMLFFSAIQNPATAFLVLGTLALLAGWVDNFFRHAKNNDNFFAFGPSDLARVGAMANAKRKSPTQETEQPASGTELSLKEFTKKLNRTLNNNQQYASQVQSFLESLTREKAVAIIKRVTTLLEAGTLELKDDAIEHLLYLENDETWADGRKPKKDDLVFLTRLAIWLAAEHHIFDVGIDDPNPKLIRLGTSNLPSDQKERLQFFQAERVNLRTYIYQKWLREDPLLTSISKTMFPKNPARASEFWSSFLTTWISNRKSTDLKSTLLLMFDLWKDVFAPLVPRNDNKALRELAQQQKASDFIDYFYRRIFNIEKAAQTVVALCDSNEEFRNAMMELEALVLATGMKATSGKEYQTGIPFPFFFGKDTPFTGSSLYLDLFSEFHAIFHLANLQNSPRTVYIVTQLPGARPFLEKAAQFFGVETNVKFRNNLDEIRQEFDVPRFAIIHLGPNQQNRSHPPLEFIAQVEPLMKKMGVIVISRDAPTKPADARQPIDAAGFIAALALHPDRQALVSGLHSQLVEQKQEWTARVGHVAENREFIEGKTGYTDAKGFQTQTLLVFRRQNDNATFVPPAPNAIGYYWSQLDGDDHKTSVKKGWVSMGNDAAKRLAENPWMKGVGTAGFVAEIAGVGGGTAQFFTEIQRHHVAVKRADGHLDEGRAALQEFCSYLHNNLPDSFVVQRLQENPFYHAKMIKLLETLYQWDEFQNPVSRSQLLSCLSLFTDPQVLQFIVEQAEIFMMSGERSPHEDPAQGLRVFADTLQNLNRKRGNELRPIIFLRNRVEDLLSRRKGPDALVQYIPFLVMLGDPLFVPLLQQMASQEDLPSELRRKAADALNSFSLSLESNPLKDKVDQALRETSPELMKTIAEELLTELLISIPRDKEWIIHALDQLTENSIYQGIVQGAPSAIPAARFLLTRVAYWLPSPASRFKLAQKIHPAIAQRLYHQGSWIVKRTILEAVAELGPDHPSLHGWDIKSEIQQNLIPEVDGLLIHEPVRNSVEVDTNRALEAAFQGLIILSSGERKNGHNFLKQAEAAAELAHKIDSALRIRFQRNPAVNSSELHAEAVQLYERHQNNLTPLQRAYFRFALMILKKDLHTVRRMHQTARSEKVGLAHETKIGWPHYSGTKETAENNRYQMGFIKGLVGFVPTSFDLVFTPVSIHVIVDRVAYEKILKRASDGFADEVDELSPAEASLFNEPFDGFHSRGFPSVFQAISTPGMVTFGARLLDATWEEQIFRHETAHRRFARFKFSEVSRNLNRRNSRPLAALLVELEEAYYAQGGQLPDIRRQLFEAFTHHLGMFQNELSSRYSEGFLHRIPIASEFESWFEFYFDRYNGNSLPPFLQPLFKDRLKKWMEEVCNGIYRVSRRLGTPSNRLDLTTLLLCLLPFSYPPLLQRFEQRQARSRYDFINSILKDAPLSLGVRDFGNEAMVVMVVDKPMETAATRKMLDQIERVLSSVKNLPLLVVTTKDLEETIESQLKSCPNATVTSDPDLLTNNQDAGIVLQMGEVERLLEKKGFLGRKMVLAKREGLAMNWEGVKGIKKAFILLFDDRFRVIRTLLKTVERRYRNSREISVHA